MARIENEKKKDNLADYNEAEAKAMGPTFWRAWSMFTELEEKRKRMEFTRGLQQLVNEAIAEKAAETEA